MFALRIMKIKSLAVTTLAVMAFLAIAGFLRAKMTYQRLPLRTASEALEPKPGGFYGGQDFYGTNIALGWSNSPGVAHYWVQRGIVSTNPGDYTWTSFCLNSNASFFVDSNVLNDTLLRQNFYRLYAEYPKGNLSSTDVWCLSWQENDPNFDLPPVFPPKPQDVQACVDSNSNVVITWTPAKGAAINYFILRGAYDPANTNEGYDFSLLGSVDASVTTFKAIGMIKRTNDLMDIVEVGAIYPGNSMSSLAACYVDRDVAVQALFQTGEEKPVKTSF